MELLEDRVRWLDKLALFEKRYKATNKSTDLIAVAKLKEEWKALENLYNNYNPYKRPLKCLTGPYSWLDSGDASCGVRNQYYTIQPDYIKKMDVLLGMAVDINKIRPLYPFPESAPGFFMAGKPEVKVRELYSTVTVDLDQSEVTFTGKREYAGAGKTYTIRFAAPPPALHPGQTVELKASFTVPSEDHPPAHTVRWSLGGTAADNFDDRPGESSREIFRVNSNLGEWSAENYRPGTYATDGTFVFQAPASGLPPKIRLQASACGSDAYIMWTYELPGQAAIPAASRNSGLN